VLCTCRIATINQSVNYIDVLLINYSNCSCRCYKRKKERRGKYSKEDLYINPIYKENDTDYESVIQYPTDGHYDNINFDTQVDKNTNSDTDNTSTDRTAVKFPNTDSNLYANTKKGNNDNLYMNTKELTTDENPYDNINVNTG
jgi:hypothetical protein